MTRNHWPSRRSGADALLATARPTVEHYLPMQCCIGATNERDPVSYPYEGFDFGSISMRMILFGNAPSRD